MAIEIPTVYELRAEIGMKNADLLIFASENAIEDVFPFNETLAAYVIDTDIEPEEIVHIKGKPFAYFWTQELDLECIRPAAVWSRFTDADHPQDSVKILKEQLEAVKRMNTWMKDPDKQEAMTSYEKETCASFLTAATSFVWHEDYERLNQLEGIVVSLSGSYGRLSMSK